MTTGVAFLLSKATVLDGVIDDKTACVGLEVFAVLCFITSKICSRILKSKFLRFLCCVVAYFSFWMLIVYGIGMYFILKYGL